MRSNGSDCSARHGPRAPLDAALDGLDTTIDELSRTGLDAMTTGQRLAALSALACAGRRLAAVENELIAGLRRDAIPAELGDGLAPTLARVTLVKPAEAARRVRDAEDTAARVALTGEPLPPRFEATAAALAQGRVGRDHVREIHRFFEKVPAGIPADERDVAERFLAELAATLRPDELRKAADQLLVHMGSEEDFTDADRARRRGFSWGPQDVDGMSRATLWATPALRAELDAIFGAWAAPGKCNPDDESPCVDGEPDVPAAERDARTPAQRRHDALSAVARAMLSSGRLGVHNGLPVSVIVSTTLQELQNLTGGARTAGGTALPMRDLVRMAAHANHYLLIYDGATEMPLWLGRERRTASPGQRIVLHSKDRGCTFPGCDIPGYLCEAHHAVTDWIDGGPTNIDNLAFACPRHHRFVTSHGWTTRKNAFGQCEWLPPPQLPIPAGVNGYHHPERYLESRSKPPPLDGESP